MYETWQAKEGPKSVSTLTDLHLLHIIEGLRTKRLFADNAKERRSWLWVMRAEAIRRDLWDKLGKPASRRVSVFDFAFQGVVAPCFIETAKNRLSQAGVPMPELDISEVDGQPSYLHWAEGGTSLE